MNKYRSLSGIVLIACVIMTSSSHAVTRHCKGKISATHDGYTIDIIFATGAGEETNPNNARREARDRLNRCFQDQWDSRWSLVGDTSIHTLPNSCRSSKISHYSNYEVDIKNIIERNMCTRFSDDIVSGSNGVSAIIERSTSGDTGCGSSKILSGSYKVTASMCGL